MSLSQCAGDKFDEQFDLYSNMIYRICMAYLKNNVYVEDIMQEIFIILIYKSPNFKTPEDEKRWLIRVTINTCKNFLKSAWIKNTVSIELIDDISSDFEVNEIFHFIHKLPEKYKTAIFLHYVEELSVEEITKTLGISKSAVKMRLKRGRDSLKKEMEVN